MAQLGEHSDLNATEINILVKMAVKETLEQMGLDLSTAEGREAARKDFAYTRAGRLNSERVSGWIMSASITVFISGVAYALFTGAKTLLATMGVK